jgi:hypothetical protein
LSYAEFVEGGRRKKKVEEDKEEKEMKEKKEGRNCNDIW